MALQKKTLVILVIVVAAVLAAVKFIVKPFSGQGAREAGPAPSQDKTQPEAMMPSAQPSAEDGAMMAQPDAAADVADITTSYPNPGGNDQVGFSLTVDAAGVVTKAETSVLAKNPVSVKRQESFAAGLPAVVVGKKVSELSDIDRVGGSSLTTKAFNDALPALKAQL